MLLITPFIIKLLARINIYNVRRALPCFDSMCTDTGEIREKDWVMEEHWSCGQPMHVLPSIWELSFRNGLQTWR